MGVDKVDEMINLVGELGVDYVLEGSVRLDEGPRHQGLAEVVRAVLRRPA